MKKGRIGITLSFYPILVFILAILNQIVLCAIVAGFAILVEKDKWTSRQTLQGFSLCAVSSALLYAFSIISDLLKSPVGESSVGVFTFILTALVGITHIAVVVLSVFGIVNLIKVQEANIPGLSNLMYKIVGDKESKSV